MARTHEYKNTQNRSFMKRVLIVLLAFIAYLSVSFTIAFCESQSPDANIKTYTDALWYSIVTLTTVGYGDYYPVTPVGKALGLLIILGSLGLLSYLLGELTKKVNTYMENKKMGFYGTKFTDHYIVIGWNNFANQVADQIYPLGNKIAFITDSTEDLQHIKNLYTKENAFAMFMDFENTEAFDKVNVSKSKAVFINSLNDSQTLILSLKLLEKYPDVNIIANCVSPGLKGTLESIGVKHVISHSEVVSKMVASYMFEPHVAKYTDDLLATSIHSNDQDIVQFKVTASNPYQNKLYFESFVDMKKNYNAILIGLVINGEVIKDPTDNQLIQENDYLIIITKGEDKKKLENAFGIQEGL